MTQHRLRKSQQPGPGDRPCGHKNQKGRACGKFHGHHGPHLYPRNAEQAAPTKTAHLSAQKAAPWSLGDKAPATADAAPSADMRLVVAGRYGPAMLPAAVLNQVENGRHVSWVVLVDADVAAAWLELNTENRPLRQTVVDRYARLMRENLWHVTHAGLAFAKDGTLLDGQHRLWAVLALGDAPPVAMQVTWNVERAARMAMDSGLARNAADAVTLDGGVGRWGNREIATLRAMLRGAEGTRVDLTATEIPAWLTKYGDALRFAHAHLPYVRGVVAEVRAAVARASLTADHQKLARFCHVLVHGLPENPAEHSAVLLRNYLARVVNMPAATTRVVYSKAEKAIFHFLRGDVIQKLQAGKNLSARGNVPELFSL